MDDQLSIEQQLIDREMAEWLPKRGDRLFVESANGARLDPLGYMGIEEKRSSVGRWQLYSGGFLRAGDRLADGTSGAPHEDELIYPILALYRHHLELELKWAIRFCADDGKLREWIIRTPSLMEKWKGLAEKPRLEEWALKQLREWLTKKHSLVELWSRVIEIYPRFGEWALLECTKACFDLLSEFDEHDPSSQASRYPEDRRGQQTLDQLDIVDLPTLKLGVHKISHYVGTIAEQIGEERDWEAEMNRW